MYSPYRRWNGCLGGIATFVFILILIAAPLLIVILILPVALVGILILIVRYRLSAVPAVFLCLGSLMTTVGVYFLIGDVTQLGRVIAVSGVLLAILGFLLDDIGKRR